jgi:hypothetical protein
MASANAATIQLRAWLNGAQEVAPVATAATGLAIVTYDTVSGQLNWDVSYSGLSSAISGAHFHGPTPAGFDAVITVPMAHGPSPIAGSATIDPTQAAQMLSGQWYVNIHSSNFSGGEIRGQVARVRGDLNGDGQSDVVWRNASTGENYLYPMNGTAILGTEGYLRTVADLNWKVVGIGDFDGDGKADILWRNGSTGENYVYLMEGTTIAGEGYLRTVIDQNWQVVGVGDVNGDGKADILWRNSSTGENYLYPMNGTAILGTEGYLRTVADLNWKVVGIRDFDGDGKADILWRNGSTGENYIYPMDGTTILGGEGYIRTVADQAWQVSGVGDFDGDGRSDILWRNGSTGDNYSYPMNGTTILGSEGYIRTVTDQNWQVAALGDYSGDGKADILWRNSSTGDTYFYLMDGLTIASESYGRNVPSAWKVTVSGTPPPPAATVTGLEFPRNDQVPDGETVRFKFTDPHTNGLPIYGLPGSGVTYIFKVRPKQQTGYYTTFFWANDNGIGDLTNFEWKNGSSDTYYGMHPYPPGSSGGTSHNWEISVEQQDFQNGVVVKDVWYTQVVRVWADGSGKHHEFYWNWPSTDPAQMVTRTSPTTWGNEYPPLPALTFGDAPWQPGREMCSCTLRGIQIYSSLLSLEDIQQEIASPKSTVAGSASIWYLNLNPTPTDISDKSGRGHNPQWVGDRRPTLWSQ